MDKSKRNLAKAIGVAGVGASVWRQPVIDSVALPAHAETSPAETSPFACSITGQTSLLLTNGVLAGPINYTVENTGSMALTNTSGGVGAVTGGVGFSTGGDPLPDPFNPGDTTMFVVTNVTTGVCPTSGEQIRISFNSDESSCELIVDVSCQQNN